MDPLVDGINEFMRRWTPNERFDGSAVDRMMLGELQQLVEDAYEMGIAEGKREDRIFRSFKVKKATP
jgi:hypothetical protein